MTPDRRAYARQYAARIRYAEQAARNAGRATCAVRYCGGHLETEVLRDGRTVTTCPRCERRRRGICRDCPRPVAGLVGRALRCADCRRREYHAARLRFLRRHPEWVEKQRRHLAGLKLTDPARYAHRLATKKAWRQRNVARIKLQKRKWRLNPDRPNGYSSREKYEAYHRDYRARKREHYRRLAIANYRKTHPTPHPICACGCGQPIPWDGLGRPAKWLPAHRPYARCLTPEEVAMKTAQTAIRILERGAEKIRKKLAGVEGLQQELASYERAIEELRTVGSPAASAQPAGKTRRGRRRNVAMAS